MVFKSRCCRTLFVSIVFLLLGGATFAQEKPAPAEEKKPEAAGDTEALAKATQNPVASLISVPFQDNINPGIGPFSRTQNVLNIQPVIPVRISENWTLINRIITPIIFQPDLNPEDSINARQHTGTFGLGDINPTFFLSPAKPGKLIWGVGPTIVLPTATNDVLGQGKWSMGPAIVLLAQPGHWTIGALVNNVWSIGGQSDRKDVNQMFFQYFINYNLDKGWYLTSSPILTANWNASGDNRWVVPVGGGVGRIMRLGFQPVNISVTAYGNAAHPPGSSPWSLRLQIALLYPKRPKK